MTLRLLGSTSGYSEIQAPAAAGDQTFTLAGTGGVLDRLERTGNILQVVNATYSTLTSSATSTWIDTGLTASITPTSASNKVLVLISQNGCAKDTNNTFLTLKLLRGSTDVIVIEGQASFNGVTTANSIGSISTAYLDSPATTSSVTYKTQFRSGGNATKVEVQASSSTSTITLLEVAA
jgi:hypothetical protein